MVGVADFDKVISVIIISYREFSFIYETLDSIFKQDYPSIQIVVTDDCSPVFPEKEIRD
ncbi:MAG: glycosyltransferase, partial [Clostridia bacterium]|nr:glycosyltransferase [Clostridia bacterium]